MNVSIVLVYFLCTSNTTTDCNRRRKTKLSALSNIFLNKEIQAEGIKGHNPEEDAKVSGPTS